MNKDPNASDSGEQTSVGSKTHISLKSAILTMACLITPLTLFIGKLAWTQEEMRGLIVELKCETKEKIADFEVRIRELEHHSRKE